MLNSGEGNSRLSGRCVTALLYYHHAGVVLPMTRDDIDRLVDQAVEGGAGRQRLIQSYTNYAERWTPYMRGLARSYAIPPRLTQDDLYGLCLSNLWSIVERWDGDIDSPQFYAYFKRTMQSRLQSAVRDEARQCRDYKLQRNIASVTDSSGDAASNQWDAVMSSAVGRKYEKSPVDVMIAKELRLKLYNSVSPDAALVLAELEAPSQETLEARDARCRGRERRREAITLGDVAQGLSARTGRIWRLDKVRKLRASIRPLAQAYILGD